MDETISMIRDIEELLIHTPDDVDLIRMLDDLQLALKQQQQSSNQLTTSSVYTAGSACSIPFPCPWSNTTILLPARVLPSNDISNTHDILVLILTPLTQETIPCPSSFDCHLQHCMYSHGYPVQSDWLLPIETMDIYNKERHYNPNSTVLYKSTANEHVWKKATLLFSDTDSTGQHQWHISTEKGHTDIVGENQVIPLVYLDDEKQDEVIDDDTTMLSDHDDDNHYQVTQDTNHTFGVWQSHTTGFGEKMMKKMGYIQGEGLGTTRQGRLEPVEAYDKGTHYNQSKRPGLGSMEKKKNIKTKTKTKTTNKDMAGTSSMFDMMNTILDPTSTQQQQKQNNSSSKDSKQTNQRKLWQLQDKMDRLNKARQQGMAAVERNKGTSMEREFQSNVDSLTRQLQSIKQDIAKVQGSLTRTKNYEKMTTF